MNMQGDLTCGNRSNQGHLSFSKLDNSNSRDNVTLSKNNTLSLKKNLKEGGGRTYKLGGERAQKEKRQFQHDKIAFAQPVVEDTVTENKRAKRENQIDKEA